MVYGRLVAVYCYCLVRKSTFAVIIILSNYYDFEHDRAYSAREFRRKYMSDNEMQYRITNEGILIFYYSNKLVYLDMINKT